MSGVVIEAASYLGPEGWANDRMGRRAWPPELRPAIERGELEGIHWSMVSASDPSRFARMDPMCRLGLMAVEVLQLGWDQMPEAQRESVGVCLETCVGSLDTDLRFLQTTRPSLFAYTLPSTVIGEVCIRYRLKGPVLCVMSAPGEPGAAVREVAEWIKAGEAEAGICLACEALDRSTIDSEGAAAGLGPVGGRAAALWLTRAAGDSAEPAWMGGSVIPLARRRCFGEELAC